MVHGRYKLILEVHEEIYAFLRVLDDDRLLVILNFSSAEPVFALPSHIDFAESPLWIANYPEEAGEDIRRLTLRPWEARVHRLVGGGLPDPSA